MNRGKFETQINLGWKLIEILGLGEQRKWDPDYSGVAWSEFRGREYEEKWRTCYQRGLFDFQLIDGALVQFQMQRISRKFTLAYTYLDCPFIVETYQSYLKTLGMDYGTVRDAFREEYYEEYILKCDLKASTTPIRYDYDADCYEEGVHPCSHVHIGDANNLRVGAEKIWEPLSFLLFVIRQCYPEIWKILIKRPEAKTCENAVRGNLKKAPFILEGEVSRMEVVLG